MQSLIDDYFKKGKDLPKEYQVKGIEQLRHIKTGWPLAVYWLAYMKGDIPEYLRFKGIEKFIDDKGDWIQYFWIVFRKTEIPKYLMYKDFEKAKRKSDGLQLAGFWISLTKKLPPKQLMYKGINEYFDKEQMNLMKIWINEVRTPPPKQLVYNFKKYENKIQQSPQLMWISEIQKPLPDALKYKGMEKFIDKRTGFNFAMIWVLRIKTPPPSYLLYDGIQNVKGIDNITLEVLWNEFIKNKPFPYKNGVKFNKA